LNNLWEYSELLRGTQNKVWPPRDRKNPSCKETIAPDLIVLTLKPNHPKPAEDWSVGATTGLGMGYAFFY
jgi:hypothetical protein